MAGYAGTPLIKKLGVKPGAKLFAISAPKDYVKWLGPLPEGAAFAARQPKSDCDLVYLFVVLLLALKRDLPRARAAIGSDGAIWDLLVQKSAKIPTDVTEDEIRRVALKTDLVDVKVCAVTDTWCGVKLVVRKHLR